LEKDFIHITDFSIEEIKSILDVSSRLKQEASEGIQHKYLDGKNLAMIFQKPSARTRVSFEIGMWQLGGYALFLGPSDLDFGNRENIRDSAQVFSRYNDIIMARVFKHKDILEFANHATVPVINGLTDYNHPCQVMSDIFSIQEKRGHLEDLQISFIGDGNNVFNSWLFLAQRLPIRLCLASPKGYEPDQKLVDLTRTVGLSEVKISNDPYEIIAGSDIVYTDVWTSMGNEKETSKRVQNFSLFQVNESLMKVAKKEAYFLHCLPAHRGEEVTNEVLDGPQSIVFDQAENRLHVQKALLMMVLGVL
tara:strand:+ start:292 stop:1209 length:918 start_codon:yes stop_codon:yes gene_type:complete